MTIKQNDSAAVTQEQLDAVAGGLGSQEGAPVKFPRTVARLQKQQQTVCMLDLRKGD